MASIVRRIVETSMAPKALGPYRQDTQAVIVDKTMYISGQLGLIPETLELVPGGVEAETEQTLKNMKALLQSVGADMGNVVKTTVLLDDINDWPKVNVVYAKYFTSHHPARAAFQVAALPKGGKVEMEAVAVIGDIKDE
ncbi:hypothetical protein CAPTEDRAFT_178589 [Capitella teleta]|uniref:2-iminobutanoate/2-iminopropanoate deaminase n=1 Tax=Capitella teleta TaxID=283909 RepID=R7TUB9_CAPTE|nr:hypothetical protein CAPTEDRAFT_178589 [Capitella teleta]|eukprot:ELT94620.1 hypothetical protein CAPTEDRAFT_178589 [Capitella teleta]